MRNDKTAGVAVFDGVGELADYYERNGMHARESAYGAGWCGGWTAESALDYLRNGDASAVADAQRLLQHFDDLGAQSVALMDEPSVAGYYPCVPEALMGEPECMREQAWQETLGQPLTIMVDVTCSNVIKPHEMRTRGVSILAAVMVLCAERPVQLYVGTGLGGGDRNCYGESFAMTLVRVETAPLDLATAAMMLSHVGFARQALYRVCNRGDLGMRHSGAWPGFTGIGYGAVETEPYKARLKHYAQLVGIEGETLVMPPVVSNNIASIAKPQEWVRETVAKFRTATAEV